MAAKKKAVKKKAVKKKVVKKDVSGPDLYYSLALVALMFVIPIANKFVVPVISIIALKNAKKSSMPWLVRLLSIVAIVIWVAYMTITVLSTILGALA